MYECPSLTADEAALTRLCWIPFDIKTISIEAEGSILCLEPTSNDIQVAKERTIFVEVPPDAVSTSANVKMHYAIIPSGPFTLPEGYQFGSPVVYIYYDGRRVTKPLALHLPHWYGGKDHAKDGLSFAVAPYSLKGGTTSYQFQLIGGGTFSKAQQYGVFLIDGHSSLFAEVFKEKATSVYLATQWEQRLASETNTRIVITYNITVWLKVSAKINQLVSLGLVGSKCQQSYYYYTVDFGCCSVCVKLLASCLPEFSHVCAYKVTLLPQLQILEQYWVNWKRDTGATVDFQFERRLFSKSSVCGKLSSVKGQEWKATLIDSEVS